MAKSVKTDNMNTQGVLSGIYFLLFVFSLGYFVTFYHNHLLSLTKEHKEVENVKNYGSLE